MSVGGWTLRLETDPDPAIRAEILAPLVAHNEAQVPNGDWGLLAVTVRDEGGAVVGGLWGRTGYGMLFVELLALGPARGQGLGRRVMALAEDAARRRGLAGIWLDTWTFQAPAFYERLGFSECGRITDYPPGHDRIFYVKRLTGQVPLA
ncbi:GNAT family N-acetyltransferase [Methylobacterium goesingense]|uniref:GNAT superfamily N-acetyltransferase n=1 Tax=Methylobacterium goesingense TaxID=243690 RepID=A0ABV2L1X0_9HYPH|nr:GNAT family N-acetyltransferase [Methylobacterium goesingense]GJD71912.1 Acetyltransferase [Methylobacterium goesingense]